eukprot:TRINITY_DN2551_c0_g2_i1.p1 TRINITY_DN2551_c0_g2~~TRINITY_DN2551_c0_g2_i1.p1  ORF type:complete len:646 (-),score=181.51 TRINITY_DN2551_c0_g2_i1:56-1954(-)
MSSSDEEETNNSNQVFCENCNGVEGVTQMPCCQALYCLYCIYRIQYDDQESECLPVQDIGQHFLNRGATGDDLDDIEVDEMVKEQTSFDELIPVPMNENGYGCRNCDEKVHPKIVHGAVANYYLERAAFNKYVLLYRAGCDINFDEMIQEFGKRKWFEEANKEKDEEKKVTRQDLLNRIYTFSALVLPLLDPAVAPQLVSKAYELKATALLGCLGRVPSAAYGNVDGNERVGEGVSSSSSSSSRTTSSSSTSKNNSKKHNPATDGIKDLTELERNRILKGVTVSLGILSSTTASGVNVSSLVQEFAMLDMGFHSMVSGNMGFHTSAILEMLSSDFVDNDTLMNRAIYTLALCRQQARKAVAQENAKIESDNQPKPAFWFAYHRLIFKLSRRRFPKILFTRQDMEMMFEGSVYFHNKGMVEHSVRNLQRILVECLQEDTVQGGWEPLRQWAMYQAVASISVQLGDCLSIALTEKQEIFDLIEQHAKLCKQQGSNGVVDIETLKNMHGTCGNCGEVLPASGASSDTQILPDVKFVATAHMCDRCLAVAYCSTKCMDEHWNELHSDMCVLFAPDELKHRAAHGTANDDESGNDKDGKKEEEESTMASKVVYLAMMVLMWMHILQPLLNMLGFNLE